jgi:selenocysteine lyase/cysteine desulfurase
MSDQELSCQRDLFDIPEGVTYLNCGYQGPQLRASTQQSIAELQRKARPWTITSDDFFTPAEALRVQFAKLIDASPDDIALVPSVSYAMATAAANLEVASDHHIVMLSEQFPSHVYAWREMNSGNVPIRTVERPDSESWTSHVLEAIDPACAVAALPGAHWTDGYRLDLHAISDRCGQTGTPLVLDLTQSLGVSPFSIKDIQVDFVAAAAYKWMLGPPGLCFMYVNPRHHGGKPIEFSWMTRKDARDFTGLTRYTDEYQTGARRFDAGGRANLANMAIATSALTQILDWGVKNIADYLTGLTDRIAELAGKGGLTCTPAAYRSAHMLGIEIPHRHASKLADTLAANHIHASMRGDKLRLSPYLYNSMADIERLFSIMGALLRPA